MKLNEIKIFAEMVLLYDQVCEVYVHEMESIENVENLYSNELWDAIDCLFNEDEEFDTGEEMFLEHFGKSLADMNKLADEFGFQRIGETND